MSGKRKKAIVVFMSALVSLMVVYTIADQINFQYRKSEYIATAKQYAADLVAADNIDEVDFQRGYDWILTNQKKKRETLYQKYFAGKNHNRVSTYLDELQGKLKKGWKWHDETIGDIQTINAWKSPFSPYVHVKLMYSTAAQCDSGGMVVYEGSVASLKREKNSANSIQTYNLDDFLVSCYGGRTVEIADNQPQGQSHPNNSMQYQSLFLP